MKIKCSEDCDKAYYSKGHKIGRDPGMPCSAWGAYLPGDEPGWRCGGTDEPIGDDIDHEDCPLFLDATKFTCTLVGLEDYCEKRCETMFVNSDEEIAICPESDDEIECTFINNHCVVGVTDINKIDEFDSTLSSEEKEKIKSNIEKVMLLQK